MEYKTLGSLVDRKIGYGIVQPGQNILHGVPVIKVNNLIAGLHSKGELDVTTKENDEKYSRTRLEGGELIVSVVGTVGKTAIVPKSFRGCNLVRAVAMIDIKENWLSRWVKYYIDSPAGQAYIEQNLNTTVQATLNIKTLVDMPIPFLKEDEMRKIVTILEAIDKKIECNQQINDNLAQQLRLLYDYWFTQFDFPDESGNPYRSSGGQMVWNNGLKRKIPESWCVVPLGEVSSFRNGINYDKNTTGDTTYHIVNVRNISSSSILLDERELDEICLPCTQAEKYLVSNESILIARSGIPGAPRILYNPSKDIIFCGFIICATPIDSILQHYLMLFLKQLEGSTATQTGGSILKNVSQDTLRDLLVPIPSKDILTQFNQRVALIYEFMHNNLEETSKLQHLRDWLLPMLMNGQATISD